MSDVLGIDAVKSRVEDFEKRLREILEARAEADRTVTAKTREEEESGAKAAARLAGDLDTKRKDLSGRQEKERAAATGRGARHEAMAAAVMERAEKKAKGSLNEKLEKLKRDQGKTKDRSLSALQENQTLLTKQLSKLGGEIVALRKQTEAWQADIEMFARSVRVRQEDEIPTPGDFQVERSEQVVAVVRKGLEEDQAFLASRQRDFGVTFVRTFSYLLIFVLMAALHGGAFAAIWYLRHDLVEKATFFTPLSFLGLLVVFIAIAVGLRAKARELVNTLRGRAEEMTFELKRHEQEVAKRTDASREQVLEDRIGVVSELDEKMAVMEEEIRAKGNDKLDRLRRKYGSVCERTKRRNAKRMEAIRARFEIETRTLVERHHREVEERKSGAAKAAADAASRGMTAKERVAAEWAQTVGSFTRMADEARQTARQAAPAWDDASWRGFKMSPEFPTGVALGEAVVDYTPIAGIRKGDGQYQLPENAKLALPAALQFPTKGSLLVVSDAKSRTQALDTVNTAILRILTSFPAAKAKFLFVDPVGLGQSFSGVMHLADFDESLVGGKIWTEPVHIEKKLTELTEHIEKVIQKYLRNKYQTIDEYNREVGIMAEAYRFLVVADFPRGFSEIASERLASIVASGARCGVYTILLHDRKEKVPAALDASRFRKIGVVLRALDEKVTFDEEVLSHATLVSPPLPGAEEMGPLLQSIGRQCVDAARVEVPFETIVPPDGQWGSLSSENGIRVPLGRAGADRLQHLDLGKGTAQHALIAGKTGSGKSTLFHVMITNSALWYTPRDLELYLIDFKKGVEFKRFATHRLPHARVVAIESDREFGVSVLRKIDRELAARAELYRAAGVQDFASYRKTGRDPIPRSILMIDEFQEFFTEEDAVAQEAALLLDRIVRQGRAFGVHVILGSQTLGGSYTLAKATLGQMGIRIALACNEADSLLILGDDNAAARLLSRPGEAIYNDMSGMVEGNNPFQVVWLADSTEEKFLARLREHTDKTGWEPREAATIFEGNVPADIANNDLLKKRLAKPFAYEDGKPAVAYVGEANAIKGPTEVRFRRQGGSNLLMVGQQRESALSVMLSSIVSLAALHPPRSARFLVLDGSGPEMTDSKRIAELAAALPQHAVEIVDYAKIPELMEELDADVKARGEAGAPARPTYLFIHDLQRFRKLRMSDDYDLGGGEGEKPTTDKCMVNVLTEGPARGVHTIAWCDTLNNLKRTFAQKTLREFEMRLLFQMSAADSSELIDTPAAGKLGLYRGLLFQEEEGTTEKFRPYALFEEPWMETVRRALNAAVPQA